MWEAMPKSKDHHLGKRKKKFHCGLYLTSNWDREQSLQLCLSKERTHRGGAQALWKSAAKNRNKMRKHAILYFTKEILQEGHVLVHFIHLGVHMNLALEQCHQSRLMSWVDMFLFICYGLMRWWYHFILHTSTWIRKTALISKIYIFWWVKVIQNNKETK